IWYNVSWLVRIAKFATVPAAKSCELRVRGTRGGAFRRKRVLLRLPVGAGMLRCIAVIIAAGAILSCGPLAAQPPDSGKKAPGSLGGAPARPAPDVRPPPVSPPPVIHPAVNVPAERAEQAVKDSIRSLDLQTELVTQEPDNSNPNSRPIRMWPI